MSKKDFSLKEIKQKMADYCVYQDRSHYEVEQKLYEYNLIQEGKEDIIIFLIQNNFLNEERFTRSFSRGKFYQKNWGRMKIANALRLKKVPENLIQKGFEEINEEDYRKTIEKLAAHKWPTIKGDTIWEKRKKLQSYLYQKGYEWELINTEIAKLSN